MRTQKAGIKRNLICILAGLVLCASLGVAPGDSASPQLKLVKIMVDRAMQEEALQNIGMEIADAQRDYVIGYATQRQVEQVQSMGVDVHVLDPDIPQLIKVSIDLQQLDALADLGLDIAATWPDYIHAIARKDQIQAVRSRGFPVTVLADNIYRLVQPSPQKAASMAARGAMPPPEKYHTYSEVVASFRQLESEYPHIARMMDIGKSLEGRAIWAMKISDNPAQDEAHEPEILFVGCHHAREWITVAVTFRLVHYLIENYETDARVRAMVDGGQIYVVPIVNPDGYVYTHESWTRRFWRKNRRNNGDGSFGVDLNRNYGSGWGITAGGASSSVPSNELYHGTAPFSEPETQVMRDFMLAHDLDLYMDYHSYGQYISFPWIYTDDLASDDALMGHISEYMARLIEEVHGVRYMPRPRGSRTPSPLSGVAYDWVYSTFNIPALVMELRPLAEPYFDLPEDQILPTFEENLPAMLYLIEWTQSTDRTVVMTSVDVTEGPFKKGDEITVTLVGEEKGMASFSIEGVIGYINMAEDESTPGTYRGMYTVWRAVNAKDAVVYVELRDMVGNSGVDSNHKITIDSLAPPIVAAEVTDPDNAYVAGDTIHIRVESEQRAEVVVDLSPLDSTKGTIKLEESRSERGIFEGSATLSQSNTNPTGVKRLLVTAEDEVGNVSEDEVEVILQKEMTLALAEGINVVSVPVNPPDTWKLSDLARFIGPEVTMIGRYDKQFGSFGFYLPDAPETSPANAFISRGEAYIVGMASSKEVTFAGTGWEGKLYLSTGNNFVSVTREVRNWRLSDLAEHIGPGVSAIYGYDCASRCFLKYQPGDPAGSPADLPVEGGSGCMVVMTASADVEFDGPAWENRGAETALSIGPRDSTPLLVVQGKATPQSTNAPLDELSVSVKNLRNSIQRTDITGKSAGEGRYSVVFDDLVENRAAQVGDELHITVTDPKAAFGARIMTYQLTPEDIRSGVVSLDIQMSSTPVVSSLLPPYPIPFNPDVWLPYQLAKPADVAISIYNIQGRLVRKLDIGQRQAGTYMNRDDAAHWDGKNTDGETIAPGIYFYSISAGKFVAKATGKLVFLPK